MAAQASLTPSHSLTDIRQLGQRVCIIGPSSSGKSTLAQRLGRYLDVPVVHLDQIAHLPGSAWKRRPLPDFVQDHDRSIQGEGWIIEGNYSLTMPQRFKRATSVIWTDMPLPGCLWRYARRCLRQEATRPGKLDGATREFGWGLVRYTIFTYPKNRLKYEELLSGAALPVLRFSRMKDLNAAIGAWGLPPYLQEGRL